MDRVPAERQVPIAGLHEPGSVPRGRQRPRGEGEHPRRKGKKRGKEDGGVADAR